MSQFAEPVPIGEVTAPPFAKVPDPLRLFASRRDRFVDLADGHPLGGYLRFLSGIADAQHAVAAALPAPAALPEGDVARAREFSMPPIDRAKVAADPEAVSTTRAFLERCAALAMPDAARQALGRIDPADPFVFAAMLQAVLDDAIPAEMLAEHVLVAAGLQVHLARLASTLDGRALAAVGDGVCPACGGAPAGSVVVGWPGAHGARFCSCAMCGTLWNYVRIRCTSCGTTKGLSYQELDGSDGNVKAECCSECRTFLKIMYQAKQPELDVVADDVATSALDLLVEEAGFARSGRNPFLIGV